MATKKKINNPEGVDLAKHKPVEVVSICPRCHHENKHKLKDAIKDGQKVRCTFQAEDGTPCGREYALHT